MESEFIKQREKLKQLWGTSQTWEENPPNGHVRLDWGIHFHNGIQEFEDVTDHEH